MKAEDTVMNTQKRELLYLRVGNPLETICKAQAEISFKAGYEDGQLRGVIIGAQTGVEEGKKAGIKEAVEYIKLHVSDIWANNSAWQAQLKIWRIE